MLAEHGVGEVQVQDLAVRQQVSAFSEDNCPITNQGSCIDAQSARRMVDVVCVALSSTRTGVILKKKKKKKKKKLAATRAASAAHTRGRRTSVPG